ncbi:MAG: DUF2142 domain-containing protein, partial [Oscillospiraceae bacterium]
MKVFLKKHRHIIGMAAVLVCGLFLSVWFAYSSLSKLENRAEYRIINDDYSIKTVTLADDNEIAQKFWIGANDRIYGVRVKIQNDGAQSGLVTAVLRDVQTGSVVGTSSASASEIKNDDFTSFFFDKSVNTQRRTQFELLISSDSQQADMISVWKSETSKPSFELFEKGSKSEGTIALQVATRFVTKSVGLFYLIFSAGLTVAAALLYWMIFCKKAKIENIFVVLTIAVGLVFCFFTPQFAAPDEYVHYANSYYYSSKILGIQAMDENGMLLVRECDVPDNENFFVKSHSYDPFAYTELSEGFAVGSKSVERMVPVKANVVKYVFPAMYAPQIIGITAARLLELGYGYTLLFARIANLFMFAALGWLAIKKLPFGKTIMFTVASFPMSLQLAGSLCYDTFVNGLSFLFIALTMNFAFSDKKMNWKRTLALAACGALLSPGKSIYILIVALCFIISKDRFNSSTNAIVSKAAIVSASMITWIKYNILTIGMLFRSNIAAAVHAPILSGRYSLTAMHSAGGVQSAMKSVIPVVSAASGEILPNGDSVYFFTFGYMLTHIEQTLALLINSIHQNLPLYLQGIIGGRLGEQIVTNVEISWVLIIGLLICALLATVRVEGENIPLIGWKKLWTFLIALAVAGAVFLVSLTWTPANYTTLFGVQGRYFIPVIPLVLFA